jgi:hypothetical protein
LIVAAVGERYGVGNGALGSEGLFWNDGFGNCDIAEADHALPNGGLTLDLGPPYPLLRSGVSGASIVA